jgi:hypothetical protein
MNVICPRSGKPTRNELVADIPKRRTTVSDKCDCGFKIILRIVDGKFGLDARCLFHNHPPKKLNDAVVLEVKHLYGDELSELLGLQQKRGILNDEIKTRAKEMFLKRPSLQKTKILV